ncbi:MAG: YhcH/YjgK/YiaL family protein [Sphaerochaeta associata]|uniref:YhcH/YjgK/YiaL family protein n=1 Tax=Sphaerochaeta associata TaxID=1129264 RepID=UPI002B1EC607|nr:YhcH/YjgK/YiaL family protein [Sphaerochaeta associata]MEA5106641.1 YhcH/YjgK/YiaL family protein [Sphaerochaeta associata]
MIHDKLSNLRHYAPILDDIDLIVEVLAQAYEEGTYQIGSLSVKVESYVPSGFSGTFTAHDSATTMVVILEGEELFGLTYSERCKGVARDEKGWLAIDDSPIKAVVTAKKGMFTLFLPREPYALGIACTNSPSVVRRMIIVLQP